MPSEADTGIAPAARRAVKAILDRYGLGELTSWALGILHDGGSVDRFELELEDQPAFKERFRAMFARRNEIRNGRRLPPISAEEILLYEKQVAELESFYGYPQGTLGDPQERMIQDVSYNELQALVAAEETFLATDQTTQQVFRQFYEIGATKGELVANSINADVGAPALQQRIQAAQVGAEAVQAGFGDLTVDEAQDLVSRGVDEAGARDAFSLLARSRQLTQNFSRSDLIALAAGEAPSIQKYRRNQERALSQFAGGGGFAGGTAGLR